MARVVANLRVFATVSTFGDILPLGTANSVRPQPLAAAVSMRPDPLPNTVPATVSVVIPCYNYADYLAQAVNSALSQAGVTVDVVIVDDRSSDDSLVVANALAREDSRVAVIAHEANSGPVTTFNDGMAAAQGEFLVRLDADDLLTPGSLARAVAVMNSQQSVGLVYGHPLHFSGLILPAARSVATRWSLWPGKDWLRSCCTTGFNSITSPEVVMRSSVARAVGGQQPLAHTHDMEMWLRIAAYSDVAYIQGVDQAWHREHAQSLSARKVDAVVDLLERRAAFEVLFAGPVGFLPGADELSALARQAIAADAIELVTRQHDRSSPNLALCERLIAIARETVTDPTTIRGWRGMEQRIAMGGKVSSRYPPFVIERLLRGLRGALRRRRWHRTGMHEPMPPTSRRLAT
jgi:hypothetical protein